MMTFLKSILLGHEGSYNICGIAIQFKNNNDRGFIDCLKGAGVISQIAINCLNSNVLCLATFGYAHVLTHEMGHALTARLLINGSEFPRIQISVNNCTGEVYCPLTIRQAPAWKQSIIDVAGPAAGIGFSIMQLLAASQLKKTLFSPLSPVLGIGAVLWISGEFLYACLSASHSDNGDFGMIRKRGGATHLALASAFLVSECALGAFAAIKLAS